MNQNRIAVPANGIKPGALPVGGVDVSELAANIVMDRLRYVAELLEGNTARLISRLDAVSRPQGTECAAKMAEENMPPLFSELNQIAGRLSILSEAIRDQIDRLEV